MDIKEIRRKNLRQLIEEAGGRQAFLEKTGKSGAQISQILSPNPTRNVGDNMAREIESKMGKPHGWMDSFVPDPNNIPAHLPVVGVENGVPRVKAYPGMIAEELSEYSAGNYTQGVVAWENKDDLPQEAYVFIPRLEVNLSAGNGRVVWEVDEKTNPQAFRLEWIQKKKLNPENLACMYAEGDSMAPYIMDGDSILVDLSEKALVDGEVYAIRYGDELRVKRLFKRFATGIRIVSLNPEYPEELVEGEDLNNVEIIGRVVWRGG